MNTKTLISAIAAFSLIFVSCKKESPVYITECNCSTEAVILNVNASDWAYSDLRDNNYFYAEFDMPEITSTVFETGLVKMYRVYDFESADAVQMEMPFSRYYEEEAEDGWIFYTESLDYEFGIGKVTIFYTLSDFFYEDDLSLIPDKMQFRCVIMQ